MPYGKSAIIFSPSESEYQEMSKKRNDKELGTWMSWTMVEVLKDNTVLLVFSPLLVPWDNVRFEVSTLLHECMWLWVVLPINKQKRNLIAALVHFPQIFKTQCL